MGALVTLLASYATRYYNDLRDLNGWIKRIPLSKRLPLLLVSGVVMVMVIYDYKWVLQKLGYVGHFVVVLSAVCLVLTPFWIGYDMVLWLCPYALRRGTETFVVTDRHCL